MTVGQRFDDDGYSALKGDFHGDSIGIAASFSVGVGKDTPENSQVLRRAGALSDACPSGSWQVSPYHCATAILIKLIGNLIRAIAHLAATGEAAVEAHLEIRGVGAANGHCGSAVSLGEGGVAGAEIQIGGGHLALVGDIDLGGPSRTRTWELVIRAW